jgi:uncharacterized membrane protein
LVQEAAMTNDGRRLNRWARILGLAASSGMRCTVGPAIAARPARGAGARRLAALAVAGELVCDKLPRMTNRTAPPGLVARAVSGAFVAATLTRHGRGRILAALAGAGVAVAAAFVSIRVRAALTRALGGGSRANAVAGLLEDALVIGFGRRLNRA